MTEVMADRLFLTRPDTRDRQGVQRNPMPRRKLRIRWQRTLTLVLALTLTTTALTEDAPARPGDAAAHTALIAEIERIAAAVNGTVGVALLHLESGIEVAVNGEMKFPLASTYKIPMAALGLQLADRGELDLASMVALADERRVVSSVVDSTFPHPGVALSLLNLMEVMLTESDNTALMSAVESNPAKRRVVTTRVEHSAILNFCKHLAAKGYHTTYLPVDTLGRFNMDALLEAIDDQTAIVSVMYANNETGVIFPIAEIGKILRARGILFHVDAVQAAGKIPINLKELPVDMISLSGHKLHAPKGVGVLYLRAHGGKSSPYIELFTTYQPRTKVLHDSMQLDYGERYLFKNKRLIIAECSPGLAVEAGVPLRQAIQDLVGEGDQVGVAHVVLGVLRVDLRQAEGVGLHYKAVIRHARRRPVVAVVLLKQPQLIRVGQDVVIAAGAVFLGHVTQEADGFAGGTAGSLRTNLR